MGPEFRQNPKRAGGRGGVCPTDKVAKGRCNTATPLPCASRLQHSQFQLSPSGWDPNRRGRPRSKTHLFSEGATGESPGGSAMKLRYVENLPVEIPSTPARQHVLQTTGLASPVCEKMLFGPKRWPDVRAQTVRCQVHVVRRKHRQRGRANRSAV